MTDLDRLLDYLSRQWLPPNIKHAYDRLRQAERCELQPTGLGVDLRPSPNGRYLRIDDHAA